jgi:outer membrane murein-binding lipoprotein Lpp
MGAVEETRKLAQDFLAPELREIKSRIEALESTTGTRFEALDTKMDARFEAVGAHFATVDIRIRALEENLGARIQALDENVSLRSAALEQRLNHRIDTLQAQIGSLEHDMKAMEVTGAARHETVMGALTHLTNYFVLSERLARLEAQKEAKAS